MLRATVDREELERLVDLNVVCTISSVDTGLALNAVAENRSTVAEAHIQVDTGMGFGGFLIGEPEKILLAYRSLPNVALSGIYTQLHAVSPKGPEVGAQLRQFRQVLDAIHAAGFGDGHRPRRRLLCPDALRRGPAGRGAGRLRPAGPVPPEPGDGLRPWAPERPLWPRSAGCPRAHRGADRLTALKRPTRVAVLPVGYQNGFGVDRPGTPACRPSGGSGRKPEPHRPPGEQRVKIIGSIGATETILNVTDVKCSAGDPAVFELDPCTPGASRSNTGNGVNQE